MYKKIFLIILKVLNIYIYIYMIIINYVYMWYNFQTIFFIDSR
jgi:hypothetical protein